MELIDCKTQPLLSNIENCPGKCHKTRVNGYCDCETEECLCDPGFSGPNCSIDTCAAAGCVNGNCVAKYLGGELAVTNKPCVCMDGWYGDRCDTTTPPIPNPEQVPNCFNDCFFYADTDISGANINTIQTSDAITCCAACNANSACNSWVIFANNCYLKTGTQRIAKSGCLAGIKCTSGTGTLATTTNVPTTVDQTVCSEGCFYYQNTDISGGNLNIVQTSDGKTCCSACNADSTCNSWVVFGNTCYLKSGTERVYKSDCLSGIKCSANLNTSTNAPENSCSGFCQGSYPFGCNTSFQIGYCNSGGGCYYSLTNSTSWCCYKGC